MPHTDQDTHEPQDIAVQTTKRPILRPMVSTDFQAWEPLWQGYLTYYESSVAADVTQATFERLYDETHNERTALIAELNGQVVGFVHYIYHAHNWRLEDVCYLQDLFVSPAARGHGVGKALIEAVYHAADAHGTPSVYWMTQEFNHHARKVYDDVGALTPFIKYQRP